MRFYSHMLAALASLLISTSAVAEPPQDRPMQPREHGQGQWDSQNSRESMPSHGKERYKEASPEQQERIRDRIKEHRKERQ